MEEPGARGGGNDGNGQPPPPPPVEPVCWVCLEAGRAEQQPRRLGMRVKISDSSPLLLRTGCACDRAGSSAGCAHARCVLLVAAGAAGAALPPTRHDARDDSDVRPCCLWHGPVTGALHAPRPITMRAGRTARRAIRSGRGSSRSSWQGYGVMSCRTGRRRTRSAAWHAATWPSLWGLRR